MAHGRMTLNGIAPPGPVPSTICDGRPQPRSIKSRIATSWKPGWLAQAAIRSRVATCSSSRTRQRSRRLSRLPSMLPRGRPERPERAAFFAFSRLALSLASVMGRRWRMAGTLGSVGFIGISQLFPQRYHNAGIELRNAAFERGLHLVKALLRFDDDMFDLNRALHHEASAIRRL